MQTEALRPRSREAASSALAQALLDASNVVALLGVSTTGCVVSANHGFRLAVGGASQASLTGKNLAGELLKDAADWAEWQRAEACGAIDNVELVFRGADARDVTLRGEIKLEMDPASGERVLIGLFVDISNAKNLEAALQRSARMEALSALVTGAVHDFNNILTVLIGNLYLVAEGVRENQALFGKVKAARDVARRGAELIKQLLSFARAAPSQQGRVDVAGLISRLEPLLAKAVGSAIKLTTQIDSDVIPVEGNSAMLESAVVNLVVNARDALKRRGQIAIRATNVSLDAAEATRHGIDAGRYVRISVIDDGPGIPDALRERIFEPFFTTKQDSGGTGLGLSMVRRMAEQSRGAIELASKAGKGTSISILLPCSESLCADTMVKTMPLSTLPTGQENVLLIADDEEILSTIQQILDVLGYTVRATSSLGEAPQLMGTGTVDLVIIDSTVTAGAGVAASTESISRVSPSTRFLFIDDAAGSRKAGAKRDLLIKPFALADLASAVRRTLDGEPSE